MERIDNIGFGNLKLIQNPEEFCYGVDAVILADFAKTFSDLKEESLAFDLGTGTGVIPLIISEGTNGKIIGVEIQKDSFELAEKNAKINGLEDRISFLNQDVKDYEDWGEKYKSAVDIVTTNPPYMSGSSGLKNDNSAKLIARHETTADLEDFIKASAYLLKDRGDLFMVHRPSRLVDIFAYGRKYKLEAKEIKFISPKKDETPNIILVHMIKNGGKELKILPTLAVHDEDGGYTLELKKCYEKEG